MFRKQSPHEGYQILKEWRDTCSNNTKWKDVITKQIVENPFKPISTDIPGPFFVLTTNVDNFFIRSGFRPEEVCQTHGNYFRWQCSGLMREKHPFKFFEKPCSNQVWELPPNFRPKFDVTNMTCPIGDPLEGTEGWTTNRPACPKCGLYARPNVYQFGDQCFIENQIEENNRANWLHAVERILKRDPTASVVFLELGVGQRLPKIQVTFERAQKDLPANQCTLIRVNPEVKKETSSPGFIGLPVGGLEALKKIGAHMKTDST